MAKIESYPQASPVTTADLLIGTDVNDSNATKNFSVASLLALKDDLTVKEEGVNITTNCTSIDVVGDELTASAVGSAVTLTSTYGGALAKNKKILAGQITSLDTTPVELVAAPGPNKALFVTEVYVYYIYNTAAYNPTPGGQLTISTPGFGSNWQQIATVGFVDQVNNMWSNQSGSNFAPQSADLINKPINLAASAAIANPGTAAGELIVKLMYTVVDISI